MEAVINKKATHNYFLSDKLEAGLALQGWEIKSLQKRKINLEASHIHIKNGEAFLFNAIIEPLSTCSEQEKAQNNRTRKLLLHKNEIAQLIGKVEQKGFTIMPVKIYRNSKHKFKLELALAKGKNLYDKRETERQKDWAREQGQTLKNNKKYG